MLDQRKRSENNTSSRLVDTPGTALEASASGLSERYGRGQTSHTVHVWWARRPHAAMRSLVFGTLCQRQDQEMFDLLSELATTGSDNCLAVERAQLELHRQYEGNPTVLDMFGGGGTIPYEAAALGATAYAVDYNPLSVFVQRSNLVYSQRALSKIGRERLSNLLRDAGRKVLEECKKRTEDIYPLRPKADAEDTDPKPFAYFWSYSHKCSNCGAEYSLAKRKWLAKKASKSVYIDSHTKDGKVHTTLSEGPNGDSKSNWVGRSGRVQCPICCQVDSSISIKNTSDMVLAVGFLNKKTGKSYLLPVQETCPASGVLSSREDKLLEELGATLPDSKLPKWSGIVNPALYGMQQHSDLFNVRQRVVVLELIRALRLLHFDLKKSHGSDVAMYIVSALSGLLDQVVDWNSRLSMWIPQNEQVGRAFSGPGIAMLWDYAETDQFLNGPANLWDKLNRIVVGSSATPEFPIEPDVRRGTAQKLEFKNGSFDAIVTDPPYYDNVFYNVLADFFYCWKRILFARLVEEGFEESESPTDMELVATKFRQGSSDAAHAWYCKQLTSALSEANRVLKDNGRMSFVYGHSSFLGWLAVVESFRDSGLFVLTTQPLAIERRQRPRSMTSSAVNTCIAIIAKPGCQSDIHEDRESAIDQTKIALIEWGPQLDKLGWASEDVGMAVFSVCVASLCRVRGTDRAKDKITLESAEELISAVYPEFSVSRRKPI